MKKETKKFIKSAIVKLFIAGCVIRTVTELQTEIGELSVRVNRAEEEARKLRSQSVMDKYTVRELAKKYNLIDAMIENNVTSDDLDEFKKAIDME
jgi:hypothetical protein